MLIIQIFAIHLPLQTFFSVSQLSTLGELRHSCVYWSRGNRH